MKHDCVVFLGFELIGHITKTLYADEISCGSRFLPDEKCQSCNSKSDANDAKKECQLSNRTGFSLQRSLLCFLIETVTKFQNAIGYHQPADLRKYNKTVYASYLFLDSVIGQLKGKLTHHACMRGQNASCERAVVSHSPSKLLFLVFLKTYNQCLVFFPNFVIVLINW